jgi:hypothetical protein
MITRDEFQDLLNRITREKAEGISDAQRNYYDGMIEGITLALRTDGKTGTQNGTVLYNSPGRRIMLIEMLFPPLMEREAQFQIVVGGFGEQDVLLARQYLLDEIGGFQHLTKPTQERLQSLLEREAERQKFLAWMEDECDEISKVPKSIPELSDYLDKWLCREEVGKLNTGTRNKSYPLGEE